MNESNNMTTMTITSEKNLTSSPPISLNESSTNAFKNENTTELYEVTRSTTQ